MMRGVSAAVILCGVIVGVAVVSVAGQARRPAARPAAKAPAPATTPAQAATKRETPKTVCPSVAGVGVTTKRRYCDVKIAEVVEDGIRIELPARTGTAVLQFDLHSRFTVSGAKPQPSRQDALLAIVGADGKIIDRAAVRGELRTATDLFDRLAGSGRGTLATAPGRPEHVRVTIPAGAAFVALVGLRQDVQLMNRADRYETAGRPIALVSNFDLTYTPARPR